ncbi:hypothetical protein U1Q18_012938 [Sarracenia purpurea var. burkii]
MVGNAESLDRPSRSAQDFVSYTGTRLIQPILPGSFGIGDTHGGAIAEEVERIDEGPTRSVEPRSRFLRVFQSESRSCSSELRIPRRRRFTPPTLQNRTVVSYADYHRRSAGD